MKVNMKQISEITGVSTATVSNALNYKRGVNAETAARVLKAAQELGYFDESRITKLKFVTFKRDGSIVEDTPFFPLMLTGIEQECRENGMDMVMSILDMQDMYYEEQVRSLLHDKSSAIIMLGTEMLSEDIKLLNRITNPFVVVDYWNGEMSFNSVQINNEDSVRYATRYLIEKGHTQIGYLRGNFRITPFKMRGAGYRSAMRRAGIPIREEYTLTVGTTMDSAYGGMKAHLERGVKLPTAFIADNDMIALGAMKAMTECGLKVPEDVSIIGFDDLPFAAVASTPLTTLYVPKQELGRIAARRLQEIIRGDTVTTKVHVSTTFIERDSVRTLK
ncbi:LacI family DNA-binding transcriptional regulator [Lachnospiraceae bacterium JLR.KK008]